MFLGYVIPATLLGYLAAGCALFAGAELWLVTIAAYGSSSAAMLLGALSLLALTKVSDRRARR